MQLSFCSAIGSKIVKKHAPFCSRLGFLSTRYTQPPAMPLATLHYCTARSLVLAFYVNVDVLSCLRAMNDSATSFFCPLLNSFCCCLRRNCESCLLTSASCFSLRCKLQTPLAGSSSLQRVWLARQWRKLGSISRWRCYRICATRALV